MFFLLLEITQMLQRTVNLSYGVLYLEKGGNNVQLTISQLTLNFSSVILVKQRTSCFLKLNYYRKVRLY